MSKILDADDDGPRTGHGMTAAQVARADERERLAIIGKTLAQECREFAAKSVRQMYFFRRPFDEARAIAAMPVAPARLDGVEAGREHLSGGVVRDDVLVYLRACEAAAKASQ